MEICFCVILLTNQRTRNILDSVTTLVEQIRSRFAPQTLTDGCKQLCHQLSALDPAVLHLVSDTQLTVAVACLPVESRFRKQLMYLLLD